MITLINFITIFIFSLLLRKKKKKKTHNLKTHLTARRAMAIGHHKMENQET